MRRRLWPGWHACSVWTLLALALLAAAGVCATEETAKAEHGVVSVENAHAPGETVAVKLTPVEKAKRRTKAEVKQLAEMLRALPEVAGASVAAVSREMLVVTPTSKQDMEQLKKALLAQPEVYELEIGDDTFRRDGAKPYDELQREMLAQAMSSTRSKVAEKVKHKLKDLFSRKKKQKRSFQEAAARGLGEDGPADAGSGRGGEVADGEAGAKRQGRKGERGKGEGIVPGSKRQAGKEGDGGSELRRRSKRRRMRERRGKRRQQGGGDGADGSGDGDGDVDGAYGAEL